MSKLQENHVIFHCFSEVKMEPNRPRVRTGLRSKSLNITSGTIGDKPVVCLEVIQDGVRCKVELTKEVLETSLNIIGK